MLEEIKASQKQEIKVLSTFEEMMQSLRFYGGVTTILFGSSSALVLSVKNAIFYIQCKKVIFKMRIAADVEFAAKFIHAMEIQIQRWLEECQKFDDRSMVNDRIVDFDPLIEMVLNSSMSVTLPPKFIIKSATKTLDTTTGLKRKLEDG